MAWIPITEADLLTAISGDELASYREAALADGQADPVQPTIVQVTNLVRGYLKPYVLGPEGTIPSKLLVPAVDIVVCRIPSRVGRSPKKSREDHEKAALEILKLANRGEYGVEEPEVASEEQISAPGPSISGRERRDVRGESRGF